MGDLSGLGRIKYNPQIKIILSIKIEIQSLRII